MSQRKARGFENLGKKSEKCQKILYLKWSRKSQGDF